MSRKWKSLQKGVKSVSVETSIPFLGPSIPFLGRKLSFTNHWNQWGRSFLFASPVAFRSQRFGALCDRSKAHSFRFLGMNVPQKGTVPVAPESTSQYSCYYCCGDIGTCCLWYWPLEGPTLDFMEIHEVLITVAVLSSQLFALRTILEWNLRCYAVAGWIHRSLTTF